MKKDLLIITLIFFGLLPIIDALVLPMPPARSKFVIPKPDVEREYGIAIDSFKIEKGLIVPNLYLGTIFSKYNIPSTSVVEILEKSKDVFDIRKIHAGNAFKVFLSKDSSHVKFLVYEQNAADFVVFDFQNLRVLKGQKEILTREKSVAGIIDNTLWDAMIECGISPFLANDLSEVYAWTIDFFGIQKGDRFKVIYEEKYVDEQFIGFGKIKSAWFENMGTGIYAFPFFQDSTESYFDEKGNSLKRAFLKAPLKYSHIGSGFTSHRLHPILKIVRPHYGVDYSAPMGTPVHSIGDGKVVQAGFLNQSGNQITIQHNSVYRTAYLHLSKYEKGIVPGAKVKQGQIIGYVGSTGLSTGAHLDFRVWKNGQPVNPLKMEAPPTLPISKENTEKFNELKLRCISQLDNIQFKSSDKNLVASWLPFSPSKIRFF